MLITMILYMAAMWYVARRLLLPTTVPTTVSTTGRTAGRPPQRRPAPPRMVMPDRLDEPSGPAEAAETLLVRELLAGRVDAATYRARMAALAAAGPQQRARARPVRAGGDARGRAAP